jgi:hypothetical protein
MHSWPQPMWVTTLYLLVCDPHTFLSVILRPRSVITAPTWRSHGLTWAWL